ncbi:MAG TPA: prephenate dehydratase domain-containing protein [Gammaproteobacteria bacterium]|nr:prephenate dehydratase domain-containing protein [Gammaproteobacteria bacterium]
MPSLAYQGRPGAWSELAAGQLFATPLNYLPCNDFAATITAVVGGTVDYGVLPIHNTIIGSISESCQLLASAPVKTVQETTVPIAHTLLALPGTPLSAIRQVYSHPAALAQCMKCFKDNPGIQPVAAADTAGAVEWLVQQNQQDIAAIAGAHTAAYYGAAVIARGLEDQPDNATRFVLFTAN